MFIYSEKDLVIATHLLADVQNSWLMLTLVGFRSKYYLSLLSPTHPLTIVLKDWMVCKGKSVRLCAVTILVGYEVRMTGVFVQLSHSQDLSGWHLCLPVPFSVRQYHVLCYNTVLT